MYINIHKLHLYPAAILFTTLISSVASPIYAAAPQEVNFLVTAYYSPLPDQCCYYRGDYDSEVTFNGEGKVGADNTAVYPGMIAAPDGYAFGTRISLPDLGMVGTVHDRGGRIIVWNDGDKNETHRIDLWMGYGEDGLARALMWGARSMKGLVYPPDTKQPAEKWSLSAFDAPASILALLPKKDQSTLLSNISFGQKKYAIRLLQKTLADLGYFKHAITDIFGPSTRDALQSFQADFGIQGDGTTVDEKTFASLTVAKDMTKNAGPVIKPGLQRGSRGKDVSALQRLMRYLGYYDGRTDGVYGKPLIDAIAKFQVDHKVIVSANAPAAGRFGPATKTAVNAEWKAKQVAQKATELEMKMEVAQKIEKNQLPAGYLAKGDSGNAVRSLQVLLANLGYFPKASVNAHFGEQTRTALLAYQLERKVIKSDKDKGAGNFGPATKDALLKDAVDVAWKQVREKGMENL